MPDASKPSHGHRYTYPSRRWQKHPLTGGQILRRTARLSYAFQKAVLAPLQPRDSRVAVRWSRLECRPREPIFVLVTAADSFD